MIAGLFARLAAAFAWGMACAGMAFAAATCSLQPRSLPLAGGTVVYHDAGAGPGVVLVHGLFANKEQWNAMACRVAAAGYRVIAPDLPGFGASQGFPVTVYRLEMQATLLQAFLRRLEVHRYHLAGNSMGGAIGSMVAERFPQNVAGLAFIGAPLGVVPWNTPLREAIEAGVNPFIPVTPAQLDLELALLFVAPPALPAATKDALVAPYVRDNLHYVQVWNIVNLYGDVLIARPPATPRALIVWGAQDRIYSAQGAPLLARALPRSELHVLADAGHLLHVERPEIAADLLLDWLRRSPNIRVAEPSPR